MFEPLLIEAHNPSPMTGRGNNTYLICGASGEALLVDAGVGAPMHLAAIGEALDSAGARLRRVLVTHGHADHASGAPAIAAAHPSVGFVKYPWPGEDDRYQVAWQSAVEGDHLVVGDETVIVLHTPGHSPDHLTLWHEASRTAFTGDLVVQGSSVMIHWSRGGNLADYLAGLERLLSLNPARLLPAHGPEIRDPAAVLRGYLEHRRLRERQVLAAVAAGHPDVQAIAESIYDGLSAALVPAARENVRAHLEKLKAEGRVFDDNGRWRI